ncbi:hypothetical protein, partial [Streptomonospora salina]
MAVSVPLAIGSAFTLIALCYALTAARIHRARRAAPSDPPPGMAGLDHYEVALLASGRRRVGELALAQAYLDGLVHVERDAGMVLDALLRPAPEAAATRIDRHPVVSRALRECLRRSRGPTGFAPDALVAVAAARSVWVTQALARLRAHGLLLPERIGRAQALRRFAAAVQIAPLVPMGLVATLVAGILLFSLAVRFPGAPLLALAGIAGFFGTGVGLYLLFFRVGPPAAMAVVTAIAALAAAAGLIPWEAGAWVLSGCGTWFAVYGIFAATNRYCGSRTIAGDAALAAARAELRSGAGTAEERAHAAVALYGLAHVAKHARGDTAAGSGAAGGAIERVGAFARRCGRVRDRAAGPSGDGGPGGCVAADGGPGGFGGGD